MQKVDLRWLTSRRTKQGEHTKNTHFLPCVEKVSRQKRVRRRKGGSKGGSFRGDRIEIREQKCSRGTKVRFRTSNLYVHSFQG